MNKESKNALQQLTGKSDLDEVPISDLQQLAESYPYFGAAHLLIAQKMQRIQDADLPEQMQKTALFFPNQQWLRYLMLEEEQNEKSSNEEQQNIEKPDEEIVTQPVSIPEDYQQPDESEKKETVTENFVQATEDNNLITLPSGQILNDISGKDDITNEPEEIPLDDDELRQQSEPLPIEESNQKIASLLSGQAQQFSKPVEEPTKVIITTEPFHTIDYFASQGIQLDAKPDGNAFDKKVHKFTDWLRQMKRINPHPSDLGTGSEEETVVATIADSSNYTREVLTESMAEVLLKQGKNEKAVEIYQKLSLLNPDKTTYFAALIQNIK